MEKMPQKEDKIKKQQKISQIDEKGLESLGRPANDYVKNKLGEDNNSKIKLSTDGIDLSNVDVGEKVRDNSLALEAGTIVEIGAKAGIGMAAAGVSTPVLVIGGVIIGAFYYTSIPEEQKEQLKEEIYEIYQNVKKSFGSILDKESSKNLVADVIKYKLKEKGIEVDVKIDKDGNVMHTMTPLPEEEKIFRLPPMDAPKQETQKERWEREERFRREQKEKDNERSKPNGIPLQQERLVTIIYTKSDGKKFDGKYKPSPKHDQKTGYPGASKSNILDIETGQELLKDSYGSSKEKNKLNIHRKEKYEEI